MQCTACEPFFGAKTQLRSWISGTTTGSDLLSRLHGPYRFKLQITLQKTENKALPCCCPQYNEIRPSLS